MSIVEQKSRAPDAAQRYFSGALQSRDPCNSERRGLLGPGSAERRCVPHRVRDTRGMSVVATLRHCERSEAIQNLSAEVVWIASLRSQ
jgi:hypothetical protein